MIQLLRTIRHIPTLLRLDRQARCAGASQAYRRADWWGNLAALEAARTGLWR